MIEKLKAPNTYISNDIQHLFQKDVVYKVKANVYDGVLSKRITIHDVKSIDTVPLRYHIDTPCYPLDFAMKLRSIDKTDVRYYEVKFFLHTVDKNGSIIYKQVPLVCKMKAINNSENDEMKSPASSENKKSKQSKASTKSKSKKSEKSK